MFQSFLVFNEVVKLSTGLFDYYRRRYYTDRILGKIYQREDIVTALCVGDLVSSTGLVLEFSRLLTWSKCTKWLEFLEMVILNGNNYEFQKHNIFTNTVLKRSASCDRPSIIHYFRCYQPKVKIYYENLYNTAIDSCSFNVIKYFIENCPEYIKDEDILKHAVAMNDLEKVRYIAENWESFGTATVTRSNFEKSRRTKVIVGVNKVTVKKTIGNIYYDLEGMLIHACRKHNLEMIDLLLELAGINPENQSVNALKTNYHGSSTTVKIEPLTIAVKYGSLELVDLFIQLGYKITAQTLKASKKRDKIMRKYILAKSKTLSSK